jgi:hypothetical protein
MKRKIRKQSYCFHVTYLGTCVAQNTIAPAMTETP